MNKKSFTKQKKEKQKIKLKGKSKASLFIMGLGQMLYGQIAKGILYLSIFVLTIVYFVMRGTKDIIGFFTLGTKKADP